MATLTNDPREKVTFRDLSSGDHTEHEYKSGGLTEYDKLYAWADEKCTPLVREITFENAEVGTFFRKKILFILLLFLFY